MIDREDVVRRAHVKYIESGITSNITEAVRLYLLHDATPEEQIPLFITAPAEHKLRNLLAENRPICEECGEGLFLQGDTRDMAGQFYPTAWVCKACGRIEYSSLTQEEWLKALNEDRG